MPIIFGCQKFSLRVLLNIWLIFCQFHPGVDYKSVAFKKSVLWSLLQKSFPHVKTSQNTSIQIKFYSPFEENCREIVNYCLPPKGNLPLKNLIPREEYPQKIALDKPPVPENSLQRIKLPFRKLRLCFRPNMIGWTIRPHNLEELLTVGCS